MPARLSDALWTTIQQSVPVVCVDVVPVREGPDGLEVGLIRRRFADAGAPVWCHVGGRVLHGETTAEAVARHVEETFVGAVVPDLGTDPQPHHVVQWFPSDVRRGPTFGVDPRKHAVSLCWALDLGPAPAIRSGGEGDRLAWFPADLASVADADLWLGTRHLVRGTSRGAGLVPGG